MILPISNIPRDEWEWMKTTKRHYIRDPKDGGRVLRNDTRELVHAWCMAHCKGKYWIGMGFGCFELESDAVLFLLKWS